MNHSHQLLAQQQLHHTAAQLKESQSQPIGTTATAPQRGGKQDAQAYLLEDSSGSSDEGRDQEPLPRTSVPYLSTFSQSPTHHHTDLPSSPHRQPPSNSHTYESSVLNRISNIHSLTNSTATGRPTAAPMHNSATSTSNTRVEHPLAPASTSRCVVLIYRMPALCYCIAYLDNC